MKIFTNTYRQSWKVGAVIVCAALGSALLATPSSDRVTTAPAPVQTSKTWATQNPQPMFGSNAWFGLHAADAVISDW